MYKFLNISSMNLFCRLSFCFVIVCFNPVVISLKTIVYYFSHAGKLWSILPVSGRIAFHS
jgi:hypothetical protein